ncbi:MAG: YigZ family protein, partial [Candidatus Delongbacteria bacterium]|nr:YigZ family protein [Candidatus Delongbacteria bacterium]
SGLIKAYKTATIEALKKELIITKKVLDIYEVYFVYDQMNEVMKILKEDSINQLDQHFDLKCMVKFSVRKKYTNDIYDRFSKIKNLKIKYLQTI